MALTFILGQPCPGGNHWDAVLHLGPRSFTVHVTFPELLEELDEGEFETFANLFLRAVVSTSPDKRLLAVREKLSSLRMGF